MDVWNRMKPLYGYQICPFCGGRVEYAGISSGHIFPDINTGQMYICRECGYQGSFLIEVDDQEDVQKMREYLKTHKGDNVAPPFSLPKRYMWLWRLMLVLIVIAIAIAIVSF